MIIEILILQTSTLIKPKEPQPLAIITYKQAVVEIVVSLVWDKILNKIWE